MVVPFENLYLMDYLRFDDFTRVEWLVFSSTCREKVSLFVCVFRAAYVVVTERIREHPAFAVAHPLPFASCRFSFQIVPFFLTGAVVFFRRDESHMAGRKRNRSIYDLRILLVSCCFFLFESLSCVGYRFVVTRPENRNVCYYFGRFHVPHHRDGFNQIIYAFFSYSIFCHAGLSKRSSNFCTLTRSIAEPMKYTCG